MLSAIFARVMRAALLLEALNAAVWVFGLWPSLGVRDRTTVGLVILRSLVSVGQMGSFMLLLRHHDAGRSLARWTVAASALLMVFEIGSRLVPSNMDPTYRWWVIGLYGGYAALWQWQWANKAMG